MNRLHIYSPPLTMADDTRLIEVFPAPYQAWWKRVNWYAVVVLLGLAVVDVTAVISMLRWVR